MKSNKHDWRMTERPNWANPLSPVWKCTKCGIVSDYLARQAGVISVECPGRFGREDFHLIDVVAPRSMR